MTVTHAKESPNTYFLFRNNGHEVVIVYSRVQKIFKTTYLNKVIKLTDAEDCAVFEYILKLDL